MIPQEVGKKVKTDTIDSRKLALLLSRGMLRSIRIPDEAERGALEVVRTRNKLVKNVRSQNHIKLFIAKYGVGNVSVRTQWSKTHIEWLESIRFKDKRVQECFRVLLDEYYHADSEVKKSNKTSKGVMP